MKLKLFCGCPTAKSYTNGVRAFSDAIQNMGASKGEGRNFLCRSGGNAPLSQRFDSVCVTVGAVKTFFPW